MFTNEPLTDFTLAGNRQKFLTALFNLDKKLETGPLPVYPVLNGRETETGDIFVRVDPSDSKKELARVHLSGASFVDSALQVLAQGAAHWAGMSCSDRAAIIRKAAGLMREQRFELAATILREAGKPWREADADVAEAIDFCEYYAAEMLRLGSPLKTADLPGEDNQYFYQPRGVAAVISPWNFPLAILCGMAVAALVTGNTVALKPAMQTNLVAFRFTKILLEAGVPPDAVALLPGDGRVTGSRLVESPLVHIICFTGSRRVGLEIIQKAAVCPPGQRHIKRVIAELGGKNAVIVDEDADLDEAVKGILYSAFGYAGQKCSACSRLLAIGTACEPLMARLSSAAKDIIVGPAASPSTYVGPVIDEAAHDRIMKSIEEAKKSASILSIGKQETGGFFISPVIFQDVSTESNLWQNEIFGPVLSCRKSSSLDEALRLANDCDYALTGGLYSRNPATIARVRSEFKVGNLYINRSCTGALVGRQPFGGFKMSGVGSKAGGPDYLLQFMEPRTVTENTMRRGFAPSAESAEI